MAAQMAADMAAEEALREISHMTLEEHATLWIPPIAYLLFVPCCRLLLSSKGAADFVLRFRSAHNAFLALYSAGAAAAVISCMMQRPFSVHGQLCEPAPPAPLMVQLWYASKFYEWVDTILLIAAGKELSSLHYNHHMSTTMVVASNTVGRAVRTSIFDIPMLLNAVVHTLMYAYYFRPAWLRPVKRLLTQMQIVQHVTVLLAIVYTSAMWLRDPSLCDVTPLGNGVSLLLYGMYLVQFVAFYVVAYGKPEGKEKKKL